MQVRPLSLGSEFENPEDLLRQSVSRFSGNTPTLYSQFIHYQPRVALQIKKSHYEIKTASSWMELYEVLSLRYQVFKRELQGHTPVVGLEFEELDATADHLVIRDTRTAKIVGSYRLIAYPHNPVLYSQSEFKFDSVLSQPGVKLELSRACIRKEDRNGVIISLLWRGITEYMKIIKARFLLGCASFQSMNPEEVNRLFFRLKADGYWSEKFRVVPTTKYQLPWKLTPSESLLTEYPALLAFYLRAGAKVLGTPAIDRDFQCVDLFTLLDTEDMNERYRERYLSK